MSVRSASAHDSMVNPSSVKKAKLAQGGYQVGVSAAERALAQVLRAGETCLSQGTQSRGHQGRQGNRTLPTTSSMHYPDGVRSWHLNQIAAATPARTAAAPVD